MSIVDGRGSDSHNHWKAAMFYTQSTLIKDLVGRLPYALSNLVGQNNFWLSLNLRMMCTTQGQEPLLANRTKLEQAQKALCTILDLDKSALDCQASGDPRLLSMTMITCPHTHLYSASGRRGHPKAGVLCNKFFGPTLFHTTSLDCTHQETRIHYKLQRLCFLDTRDCYHQQLMYHGIFCLLLKCPNHLS